eukprot:scaffold63560_cov28-Tisochrysis_lutea.AAC.2
MASSKNVPLKLQLSEKTLARSAWKRYSLMKGTKQGSVSLSMITVIPVLFKTKEARVSVIIWTTTLDSLQAYLNCWCEFLLNPSQSVHCGTKH